MGIVPWNVSGDDSYSYGVTTAPTAAAPTLLGSAWLDIEKFFGIHGQTTASISPTMTDAQKSVAKGAASMQNIGLLTTIMGGVNAAIGGYYAAEASRYQAKSTALNLGYQADMAAINARGAEYTAEGYLEAGKSQIQSLTMAAGQQKSAATASMASRGIALGEGSAQEFTASQDLVKDMSVYTINSNATREAAAARMQAANYRGQAIMDRTGAVNANLTAGSISPFQVMTTSLMSTASSIASQWNQAQRLKMYGYGYPGGYSSAG